MKINLFVTLIVGLISMSTLAVGPIFYPAAPEQPRIQFLKHITGSSLFISGNRFGNKFPGYVGKESKDTNTIAKPYGIATIPGKIFVCDQGAGMVKIFDLEKKYIGALGNSKRGKLMLPLNIAIDIDGTRYVVDGSIRKILVYDTNNMFIKDIGNPSKMKPTDIVLVRGKIYVTDVANSQIVVFDPKTGNEISRFSQRGDSDGSIFKATTLTADSDGNIIVGDTLGGKVTKFTSDGKFMRNFGSIGDSVGQFHRPKGVAVDHENRLYAVDAAFENIQIFDSEGKILLPFGEIGNVPGGLNMPAKIVLDYDNVKYFKQYIAPGYDVEYLILVSNQFGLGGINVYGFLKK